MLHGMRPHTSTQETFVVRVTALLTPLTGVPNALLNRDDVVYAVRAQPLKDDR